MAKEVKFGAEARRRFEVEGLGVMGSVLGKTHTFFFEEHQVSLVLPTESPSDVEEWNRRTRKFRWSANDLENPKTTSYAIRDIDMITGIHGQLGIDERALSERLKSRHATKRQGKKLDQTADRYAELLAGAFELWKATLRWIVGHLSVGMPSLAYGRDAYGGHVAYIHRKGDGQPVWAQSGLFVVRQIPSINLAQWNLLQEVLSSNHAPPVWFDFISEAHQRHSAYDERGAVLSATIACETLIRSMFWLDVPNVQNDKVRDLIDRTAAQAILGRWEDIAGECPDGEWDTGKIHKLFEVRNRLMHAGETQLVSRTIKPILDAATDFVKRADSVLCEKKGIPDWPSRYISLDD